ncbi:hypothetical protein B0H16DRAFT_1477438 [Mycena metata]|uniref:Uncharacterized protein n=1 Tax=Mycena metata TaxID=1033252 RepID=A0AAD7H9N1_9AGAR|nr:hypothetical protein B0H16DRAFT_1477438 [Mycena metata]
MWSFAGDVGTCCVMRHQLRDAFFLSQKEKYQDWDRLRVIDTWARTAERSFFGERMGGGEFGDAGAGAGGNAYVDLAARVSVSSRRTIHPHSRPFHHGGGPKQPDRENGNNSSRGTGAEGAVWGEEEGCGNLTTSNNRQPKCRKADGGSAEGEAMGIQGWRLIRGWGWRSTHATVATERAKERHTGEQVPGGSGVYSEVLPPTCGGKHPLAI